MSIISLSGQERSCSSKHNLAFRKLIRKRKNWQNGKVVNFTLPLI
ncbi:hypothetical protein T10_4436 [Trichinella papuae]|uniref:Uncharacterized protein n=1 Tax=Trichinella papuae TaxID=268474 RepID=A0A0V1LY83_9BILA|nr:hypothetical protein T10_4436 [Trichinella papuae]